MRALLGIALWLGAGMAWAAASAAPFTLHGEWRQGEVLRGKASPEARLSFNGRALTLTEAGDFVLGLDRDAPTKAEIVYRAAKGDQPQTFHYTVEKRTYDIQRINGLPKNMVTPDPAIEARIVRENRQIIATRNQETRQEGFVEPFIWPCEGRISGIFGNQRILNGVPKQPHYAVDVAVPVGTPVKAPADGIVTLAQPDFYLTGGTLMIDHGHGLVSTMIHLSRIDVKVGETVKQGQVIAQSGVTGRATGPHLHWGVSWFNARVDAQRLVPPMPGTP